MQPVNNSSYASAMVLSCDILWKKVVIKYSMIFLDEIIVYCQKYRL